MSLELKKSVSAMAPGLQTSVVGNGGTEPYVYSVLPGGAGGTINASTGVYTAPSSLPLDPKLSTDTIQVEDADLATATGTILVTSPLGLFAEIIQKEMGLDSDHIYFWDQKLPQPKGGGIYIAVSVIRCKPFANVSRFNSETDSTDQFLSVAALLGVDIISRSNQALFRKEEVLLALNSDYAKYQQSANSFFIGKLPPSSDFINLSIIDGAAIPYRFRISIGIQYAYTKNQIVPYFDTFEDPEIVVEA
jgi:hypothetical protein